MQLFAIFGTIPQEHDKIVEKAKQSYGNPNVYTIAQSVIVASSGRTTQEVATSLGIGDDQNDFTGVVVQAGYYWGYHSKSLWEWMAARSKSNGN